MADPCPDCGGSGRTRVTSEQTIEFPAGTHDGDEVRIGGMGHAGTNGAAGGDLVGRAHVEAERLEGKARTGFYLMGIVAPFLVLSAISGVFSAFAVMCFIPFAMGLFMVLSDGVLHRSLLWWKRGAMQFANGFANGFMFALVSVWFASCSNGPCFRRTKCNNIKPSVCGRPCLGIGRTVTIMKVGRIRLCRKIGITTRCLASTGMPTRGRLSVRF